MTITIRIQIKNEVSFALLWSLLETSGLYYRISNSNIAEIHCTTIASLKAISDYLHEYQTAWEIA